MEAPTSNDYFSTMPLIAGNTRLVTSSFFLSLSRHTVSSSHVIQPRDRQGLIQFAVAVEEIFCVEWQTEIFEPVFMNAVYLLRSVIYID